MKFAAGLFSRSHKEWSQPIVPALTIFLAAGWQSRHRHLLVCMPNHKLETATVAAVKNVSLTPFYGENIIYRHIESDGISHLPAVTAHSAYTFWRSY
jgi:hypothetical protein